MVQLDKKSGNEWSDEQHLAASAVEQNKLKNEMETARRKLVTALASPFTVSSIPCEEFRKITVKCIENVRNDDVENLDFHFCFDSLRQYNQCSAEVRDKYSSLAAAFAERSKSYITSGEEKGRNA